jgi:hypothetical protein
VTLRLQTQRAEMEGTKAVHKRSTPHGPESRAMTHSGCCQRNTDERPTKGFVKKKQQQQQRGQQINTKNNTTKSTPYTAKNLSPPSPNRSKSTRSLTNTQTATPAQSSVRSMTSRPSSVRCTLYRALNSTSDIAPVPCLLTVSCAFRWLPSLAECYFTDQVLDLLCANIRQGNGTHLVLLHCLGSS